MSVELSPAPRMHPPEGASTERPEPGRMGHVAFVVPHPYLDSLACFREPIKWLADQGWIVHVYMRVEPTHPAPSFHRADVRVIPIHYGRAGLVSLLARLVRHRPRYRAIFTVPQWGLHYVSMVAPIAGIPVVCISDELSAEAEATTSEQRLWKERERRAHQRCAMTIALSPERGEFIRQENRLGADHPIVVVPNSVPAPAERLRSHYYQDTLGIPEDVFIVLHAGGLGWRPAQELARVARDWDSEDMVLVFQGRLREQIERHGDHEAVRYSRTVLPSELLDYAVSSAHVGVALYDDRTANDRLMSTASGKLNLYLKNGLPVITTRLGCFDWVEREGVGIRVGSMDDVDEAVRTIRRDYDAYTARVLRFYEERLDFGRNFAPVAAWLRARSGVPEVRP